MTILQLISCLQKFSKEYNKKVFSLREIAAFTQTSASSAAMTLIRASKKGIVARVGNLWLNRMDPPDLLEVALSLVLPSYLSFEGALYHHGILSQAPRGKLTMATTGRSRLIQTPFGNIQYIHLKTPLFFGFDEKRIAYPEKAWLDLLYIRGLRNRSFPVTEKFYLKELNPKKVKKLGAPFPLWVQKLA